MANVSLRPAWPDILDPNFRAIHDEQEKQLPSIYSNIFTVLNSEKQNEQESSASGLSKLVETAEGAAITYEDPNQGYDVKVTTLASSCLIAI